ncbi:MAG: CHAD domain-containing protein [Labedaea sp.]
MRGSTHSETERKYELGTGVRVPALDRVPGVARETGSRPERLDAVYFDTKDLRLARAGLTLRRRTGGPDQGWHLKVPAGPDTRAEVRVPLDGPADTPPDELTDLVLGHTRGAKLAPVARITTNRGRRQLLGRDGTALAEVTDDRVTATRSDRPSMTDSWREIEVELAAAGPELLDAAEAELREAGITPSRSASKLQRVLRMSPASSAPPGRKATAGEVVLAYLRTQAESITKHDLLARQGADDAVHQLRVAVRRMRAALSVYGRVVERDRTRRLTGELRWLGRRLGPARNSEMLERLFRDQVAALPAELVLGPVDGRITRHFAPAGRDAARTVRRTLRDERYLRLLDEIHGLLADPPLTKRASRRAKAELPKHVRRAYRKTARRIRDLGAVRPGPRRDVAVHQVRKAARRLRYAVECADPAIGRPARRTGKRAKALTKLLGGFQDSVVARPVARELATVAHLAGENGFTFGLLHGRLSHQADGAERELLGRWARISARKSGEWFGASRSG